MKTQIASMKSKEEDKQRKRNYKGQERNADEMRDVLIQKEKFRKWLEKHPQELTEKKAMKEKISKIVESILNKKAEQFVTTLKGITNFDVYHINKWEKVDKTKLGDLYFDNANLTVKWSSDIEMRDWGIKGIIAVAHSVSGTITVTYDNEDAKEETFEFDTKDNFTITSEIEFSGGQLAPSNVEIDFATRKVVVS